MRIPYDIVRDGLSAINSAAEEMWTAQQQVSSGQRMTRAGDDPLGTQQAVLERAGLGSTDAYLQSRDAAASRLASADAVLASFGDKLASVISTGLSARGSSITPAARAAASAEVRGLRDSLLADINSSFGGVPLFGGTQSNTAAYASVNGAWTYQGTSDTAKIEVEHGRLVAITFDGQALAQGTDTADIFTFLDQLANAIDIGDDAAMAAAVAGAERALDRTFRMQGQLGADERAMRVRFGCLSCARRVKRADRIYQGSRSYYAGSRGGNHHRAALGS
jgi:flagellar hook-associated protein 3 FlgL